MKHLKKKERYLFIISSLLLIAFQIGVSIKLCQFPDLLRANMLMLYVALAVPFFLHKIKDKKLYYVVLLIYIIYFALVAGGFVEAMFNPNVNCTGEIHLKISELVSG